MKKRPTRGENENVDAQGGPQEPVITTSTAYINVETDSMYQCNDIAN
jgi:hypothetical protein